MGTVKSHCCKKVDKIDFSRFYQLDKQYNIADIHYLEFKDTEGFRIHIKYKLLEDSKVNYIFNRETKYRFFNRSYNHLYFHSYVRSNVSSQEKFPIKGDECEIEYFSPEENDWVFLEEMN